MLEESQEEAGCNCGTDDACHVRAHGVHQKEVGAVDLCAHGLPPVIT